MFFGAQLYTALIALFNGGNVMMLSIIISMIVAGSYSFFSPVRVTAIDAL